MLRAGQCEDGWQCLADGCIHEVGTCAGDTGGGACEYTCADYDYGPGECYEGWTCDSAGECLLYTGDC